MKIQSTRIFGRLKIISENNGLERSSPNEHAMLTLNENLDAQCNHLFYQAYEFLTFLYEFSPMSLNLNHLVQQFNQIDRDSILEPLNKTY